MEKNYYSDHLRIYKHLNPKAIVVSFNPLTDKLSETAQPPPNIHSSPTSRYLYLMNKCYYLPYAVSGSWGPIFAAAKSLSPRSKSSPCVPTVEMMSDCVFDFSIEKAIE